MGELSSQDPRVLPTSFLLRGVLRLLKDSTQEKNRRKITRGVSPNLGVVIWTQPYSSGVDGPKEAAGSLRLALPLADCRYPYALISILQVGETWKIILKFSDDLVLSNLSVSNYN